MGPGPARTLRRRRRARLVGAAIAAPASQHLTFNIQHSTEFPMSDIEIKQDGPLLWLRINRPARKNALTHAMYTDMTQGLQQARESKEVRVVIITGTDGCFSAGNDMNDFLQHPPTGN